VKRKQGGSTSSIMQRHPHWRTWISARFGFALSLSLCFLCFFMCYPECILREEQTSVHGVVTVYPCVSRIEPIHSIFHKENTTVSILLPAYLPTCLPTYFTFYVDSGLSERAHAGCVFGGKVSLLRGYAEFTVRQSDLRTA
jgi:hypothetical protein